MGIRRKEDCSPEEWAAYLKRMRSYNAKYYAKPEALAKRRAAQRAKYARTMADPARAEVIVKKRKEYHQSEAVRARDRLRNSDPERKKADYARHVKRLYGLTAEEMAALLEKQDHRCAVCRREFGVEVKQHVDHCHDTGRVRGLLCARCNSTEGFLRTLALTPEEFGRRLAAYLCEGEEQLW